MTWKSLNTPQVLLYRDQYFTVWADGTNDTIGGLTTTEQPIIYVPTESQPAIESQGEELTHVELAQTSELVPIAPTVDYSEIGDCLVVSGAIGPNSDVVLNSGLCIRPIRNWK